MKASLFAIDGKKMKTVDLPMQFEEDVRPDLIMRSFLASQSAGRQTYGAYIRAGQRSSSKLSRRRRDYKTAYGLGISRVPRKILWHRGTQFGWVGAQSPATVGGRRAHPPKAYSILTKKINKQEKRKALRSALAATAVLELVKKRGHHLSELPLVIDNSIENLAKTKQVEAMLKQLGLGNELLRTRQLKVRPGRGKMRGRKYKHKTGPLLVVSTNAPIIKAAHNIPGVQVTTVNALNIHLLAPGGIPGRLTLFSEKALELMSQEKLFTNDHIIPEKEKKILVLKEKKIAQAIKENPKPVKKAAKQATKAKT